MKERLCIYHLQDLNKSSTNPQILEEEVIKEFEQQIIHKDLFFHLAHSVCFFII